MSRQVIHDDDIAWSKVGEKLLSDEGIECRDACSRIDRHPSTKSVAGYRERGPTPLNELPWSIFSAWGPSVSRRWAIGIQTHLAQGETRRVHAEAQRTSHVWRRHPRGSAPRRLVSFFMRPPDRTHRLGHRRQANSLSTSARSKNLGGRSPKG